MINKKESKVSHPKYRVVYTFMFGYSKLYITIKSFPSKILCQCIHLCWVTQNFTSQSKVSHPKYRVSVYIYVWLLKTLHHNQKFPIQNIVSVYTFMFGYSKLYITIKSFPSKILCQCIHLCLVTQNFTSQSKVSHPKYCVSVYIYDGLLKTLHHNQKFPIQNIVSVYTFMLGYSKLYITIKSFPSKILC